MDAYDFMSTDPSHVAAAVPRYLHHSDGHGAARAEEKKVQEMFRHSSFLIFIVVTEDSALM